LAKEDQLSAFSKSVYKNDMGVKERGITVLCPFHLLLANFFNKLEKN